MLGMIQAVALKLQLADCTELLSCIMLHVSLCNSLWPHSMMHTKPQTQPATAEHTSSLLSAAQSKWWCLRTCPVSSLPVGWGSGARIPTCTQQHHTWLAPTWLALHSGGVSCKCQCVQGTTARVAHSRAGPPGASSTFTRTWPGLYCPGVLPKVQAADCGR